VSQKLYVIVAELPNGNRLVTENKPWPLSQALEVALTFNQTMFSTAPAGGLTEWFCREGWKRYRR
jgi:hypothetical protein